MLRVGQNRIHTPFVTVYLMLFLQEIPCMHRIIMVLANPTHAVWGLAGLSTAHSTVKLHTHTQTA